MRSLTAKVVLIFLLSSAVVYCQDFNLYPFSTIDYSFLGSGARARGMGGAFTGVADDASALTWNPAGLVQVDKTQASIAGVYMPLQLKSTVSYAHNPSYNISSTFKDQKLKPNFASFVAPIRIKGHPFMASATYQSLQDQINDEYTSDSIWFYGSAEGTTWRGLAPKDMRRTYTGGLDQISLGFGTGLYGDFSIGGGVNIYTGTTESNYYSNYTTVLPYVFGQDVLDSVWFHGITSVYDKATTKGVNFIGSLFYKKDKFRAGVTIKSPFQMVTDHDLIRRDTVYDKQLHTPGGGNPVAFNPTLFRGKTKIQIPLEGAIGLSYQVTPSLVLAGDVDYAKYANTSYYVRAEFDSVKVRQGINSLDSINTFTLPGSMYFEVPAHGTFYNSAGKLIEVFNSFDLALENSMQVRFGGEYSVKSSYGTIPVRAGFRLVQGPYREVSEVKRDNDGQPIGFVLGKKVSNTVLTFGTGIHWRQIWLDFAMEYAKQKQTETGATIWGNYSTEKARNLPSFTLNFTGFF